MQNIYCSSLSNTTEMKAWDAFVESHPCCTPYHFSCWLKTIKDTYNFKEFLFLQKDQTGNLRSIIPLFRVPKLLSLTRRMISVPFSDYGGAISNEDDGGALLLSHILRNNLEKKESIEIRGGFVNEPSFKRFLYYKRHTIDLEQGLDKLREKIDKKTILYSIRKAEKAGVIIEVKNDFQAMLDFYRLNVLTRNKHGVPCQPFMFFKNLHKNIIEPTRGYILTARHESSVIAASIFITAGKLLHYKYNASDPESLKRFAPNHLLLWQAIQFAKEKGLHGIDFGRTSPDNEGLIRYKNMWGAECVDAPYYYFPKITGVSSMREQSGLYPLLNKLWSKLPDKIVEAVSPYIFRFLA